MWQTLRSVGLVLLAVLLVLYLFLRHRLNYWLRHNVPHIKPALLVGNLGGLLRLEQSSAELIRDLYNHPAAKDRPLVGIHVFTQPAILVRDPELVKRVLIRDFPKFCNRHSTLDANYDPLGSQNIFFLKNPAWKEVRLKLTPFFSSGKLKQMFHLIEEVGRNLDAYLLQLPAGIEDSFDLEMKEVCSLYTTDVIATVAYGVQANSFTNPNGQFRRHGRKIFRFNTLRAMQYCVAFFMPSLVPYLRIKVVPKEQTEFLRSTFNYIVQQREESGQFRNDLIDILIDFKNQSKRNPQGTGKLTFEGDLLLAQAAIFFTAGFESSSATMSFTLYELAKNPAVQKRVRDEIKSSLSATDGQVTQNMIESLEYMQMVICETLRHYPPLPFLDRECTAGEKLSYSLQPFQSFSVPHGMPVYIPVYGLHMDPKYFPNPNLFDPDRFSGERKKHMTPYTYLPFGLGPHSCIGERLAILQTKVGLLYFLRNHRVTMSPKTSPQMRFDPKSLIVQAKDGIHLRIERDPLDC